MIQWEAEHEGQNMRIQEVMRTDLKCCIPSDTATQAVRTMMDLQAGIVPIVDDEQHRKLIGVVMEHDLFLEVEKRDSRSVRVSDCMTHEVIGCRPEDDVQMAVELMRDNHIHRIPVVDQDDRLQGSVSLTDILHRADTLSRQTLEALADIAADIAKVISEPSEFPNQSRSATAEKRVTK